PPPGSPSRPTTTSPKSAPTASSSNAWNSPSVRSFSGYREGDDQPMTEDDERDYERFLEGLAFFGKLDLQQAMEHFKQHKEDALCSIRHFSGTGSASCTKDGMLGLRSLLQRRVKARDDGKNFDVDEVVQCVSD